MMLFDPELISSYFHYRGSYRRAILSECSTERSACEFSYSGARYPSPERPMKGHITSSSSLLDGRFVLSHSRCHPSWNISFNTSGEEP
ncbi:MAG: hypothetical protein ACYTFG_00325 [Planctomycetota bacterium]|jgi:hypothetical protein